MQIFDYIYFFHIFKIHPKLAEIDALIGSHQVVDHIKKWPFLKETIS